MITSTQNPHVKALAKLHQKKHRDETGQFVIDGTHLVEEAVSADVIQSIYTLEKNDAYPDAHVVSPHVMKKIAGTTHIPTIAAICRKAARALMGSRVLILEGVQDPGNVGTLLRSARAFGFLSIVLDNAADPYNSKTLRASQGAIFGLSLFEMDVKIFRSTYPKHILIASSPVDCAQAPPSFTEPLALILGNEGAGLRTETLTAADFVMCVETKHVDSLNVAVAGSILMHTVSQRIEK